MIISLVGSNQFLLKAELDKIAGEFKRKHGDLALERVDCAESDYEKIQESLTSLPFLATKKMVILRDPAANKQFVDNAEKLLAELPETTEVIIYQPKTDKRSNFYKLLKKETDLREFEEMDTSELTNWLLSKTSEEGGSISLGDAKYLIERVGGTQQVLANELDKLLLYDKNILRSHVDLLTDPTPQSTIFELLETAFAGNTKKTLKLYEDQRSQRVEPQQIIAMLAWQLHVLAVVKTSKDKPVNEIAKNAKLNPFVVRKSQSITRYLSLEQIRKLVQNLLKIDARMKSENIDADEALKNYLLGLTD